MVLRWYEYLGWASCSIVVLVLIWWLIEKFRFARQKKAMANAARECPNSYSGRPYGFGYKMAWLAIPCDSPQSVARLLAIDGDQEHVDWSSGVQTVYSAEIGENVVFVTPPIDGWMFVIGWWCWQEGHDRLDVADIVKPLSSAFGRACGFVSHRVSSVYGWILAENGEIRRTYLIGDGQIDRNEGEIETVEQGWGINLSDPGDALQVDEESVFEVAAQWSLDPRMLEDWTEPVPAGILIHGKKGR